MTTLKDIFEIEKHFSKQKIPCDIKKLLEQERYSESKNKYIKNGDMHLAHYIRSSKKRLNISTKLNLEMAIELINLRNKLNSSMEAMEKLKPIITRLGRL